MKQPRDLPHRQRTISLALAVCLLAGASSALLSGCSSAEQEASKPEAASQSAPASSAQKPQEISADVGSAGQVLLIQPRQSEVRMGVGQVAVWQQVPAARGEVIVESSNAQAVITHSPDQSSLPGIGAAQTGTASVTLWDVHGEGRTLLSSVRVIVSEDVQYQILP